MKALACAALGAAALAAGCQSGLLGLSKPDEATPPPEQPEIEPFDEIIPQKAFGPTGPLPFRWPLAARLRLSPPNDAYSLFISDVRFSTYRDKGGDQHFRCHSAYVASSESYGKHGALLGGAPLCTGGGPVPPSWPALDIRQISCQYEAQLTVGMVRADLEAVRITFSSGAVRTYRLDGPRLASAPRRRVFLLDHGALTWTLAEGLTNGRVAAREKGTTRYCD